MTSIPDVRCILFDTFGTVVDWRTSLINDLTTFGRARGMLVDWAALVDAWRTSYQPSMQRVRAGERPWAILDDLHRENLEELVKRFGIGGLTEADLTWMNLGWHRLHPWPDAIPGLTRLRRKYVLGPLSNGNVSLLIDLSRHGGLPWDVVFGSDVFRHFKPDREIYLGACNLLGQKPSAVMLCAAHNDDLRAARSHGLATAFVPRVTEWGPDQTEDLAPADDWDLVATDLGDLADKLGC